MPPLALIIRAPQDDVNIYVSIYLLVHHERPSMNLPRPEHLSVDAFDTLACLAHSWVWWAEPGWVHRWTLIAAARGGSM